MGCKQGALSSIIESKTQEKLLLAHKPELCKQPPSVNPVLAGDESTLSYYEHIHSRVIAAPLKKHVSFHSPNPVLVVGNFILINFLLI